MRSVKHGKKRQSKYRYARNTVNSKAKALKRKKDKEAKWMLNAEFTGHRLKLSDAELAAHWDSGRTAKQNLEAMGLASDANKIAKGKKKAGRSKVAEEAPVPMEIVHQVKAVSEQKRANKPTIEQKQTTSKKPEKKAKSATNSKPTSDQPVAMEVEENVQLVANGPEKPKPKSTKVVEALENAAAAETMKQHRDRVYRLLPQDVIFCVQMIERHGDNFEAMAKDHNNHYQETAKQIARKIRVFKESPQYETYLKSKADGTTFDAHANGN